MEENRIVLEVDIEVEATKVKVMELQEALKDQKSELKSIEEVGGKAWQNQAKDVVNTEKTIKELNKAMQQKVKEDQKMAKQVEVIDKAMQGQLKTDREVNAALAAMRQQRMDVNKDTAEGAKQYEVLTNKIQELSKEQVEANRSGKMYWDNVGNYQESVEKALDSTTKGMYAMRQEMQELRKIPLDNLSPEEILEVESAMGQLQDTMDKTTQRIKVQAMDDLPALVASMQAVVSASQLVVGAMGLFGAEDERVKRLTQTMVQLVGISQSLAQVQQLIASGQAAALAVKVKDIALTSAKTVATGIATAAQWAFNTAVSANPIGIIIMAIVALVAGIVALVTNIEDVIAWFKKLGDYIMKFARWLGLAKEKEEELTEAEKEAAAAKEAHAKAVQALRAEYEKLKKANVERRKDIDNEIRLLESQGAAIEEIIKLKEEKIQLDLKEAKTALALFELQNQQLVQLLAQYDLMGMYVPSSIRKQIESYKELKDTVSDLELDLEIFHNNESRRLAKEQADKSKAYKDDRARREKDVFERIKSEEFAQAKLNLIIAKSGEERLQRQIELLELDKRYKLLNEKLTESERLLIQEEYRQAEAEAKEAFRSSEIAKEEAYRKWIRERFGQELDEIDKKYNAEIEKLKEFYEQNQMTTQEFWDLMDELELQRELEKEERELQRIEKEREEYDQWMQGQKDRDLVEIEMMQAKLARFAELRDQDIISQQQYLAAEKKILKQMEDAYVQMQMGRVQSSLSSTDLLVKNTGEVLGMEAEAAKVSKAIAIAQTTIDIVRTISQATALGPPQNIPMILLALAQTAGLISQMKSVSVPEGFAEGGYTGAGGKYSPAGVVHKGEVVWSQQDVAMSGGWKAVDSMRPTNKQGRGQYYTGGVVGFGETGELADDMQLQVVDAIREMKPKVTVEDINAVMDSESNRVEVAII